jgi:hypothetical protein
VKTIFFNAPFVSGAFEMITFKNAPWLENSIKSPRQLPVLFQIGTAVTDDKQGLDDCVCVSVSGIA